LGCEPSLCLDHRVGRPNAIVEKTVETKKDAQKPGTNDGEHFLAEEKETSSLHLKKGEPP